MKVYNLTTHPFDFHGRIIPPNGGAVDYPELDTFLPSRDKKLEEKKLLSFGWLPSWWLKENEKPKPAHKRVTIKVADTPGPQDAVFARAGRKRYQG